jgi:hypothetical protein
MKKAACLSPEKGGICVPFAPTVPLLGLLSPFVFVTTMVQFFPTLKKDTARHPLWASSGLLSGWPPMKVHAIHSLACHTAAPGW